MRLTDEQRAWLTLSLVPGVGTANFIRLLARFHTPAATLAASRPALEQVVGKALAQRVTQYAEAVDVEGQEAAMAKLGVGLITLEDPEYPPRLAEIYDPPLTLFIRGELLEADRTCVAIVGTRRASPYGLRMAEKLGGELAARGITVVSGMAAGIDTAAHRGALGAGGRTIAVLGCGVDIVFPPQNEGLMSEIMRQGCVLSQFPMGMKPLKGNFPYRNRIISGMTLGTVVVEAPAHSGALITARTAAEQGREVFAVPGQVGYLGSEGPHALIREGAKLVETAEDILVELNLPAAFRRPAPEIAQTAPASQPARAVPAQPAVQDAPAAAPTRAAAPAPRAAVSEEERRILQAMAPDGSHVDELAMACRIPVSEALSALTLLELKGLVRQFSGKRFAPR